MKKKLEIAGIEVVIASEKAGAIKGLSSDSYLVQSYYYDRCNQVYKEFFANYILAKSEIGAIKESSYFIAKALRHRQLRRCNISHVHTLIEKNIL